MNQKHVPTHEENMVYIREQSKSGILADVSEKRKRKKSDGVENRNR